MSVPNVGGFELPQASGICARVGFVSFHCDDCVLERHANTCGPEWPAPHVAGTRITQIVADDEHVAILCADATVTVLKAFTGEVVAHHDPIPFGGRILLAMSTLGVIGVVCISRRDDVVDITWHDPAGFQAGSDVLCMSHFIDAQAWCGRLYVLQARGKLTVYDIQDGFEPATTLVLPRKKMRQGVQGLMVLPPRGLLGEGGPAVLYRGGYAWRIPLEFVAEPRAPAVPLTPEK